MSHELWADVLGWEGFYEVSDRGRVRSLRRIVWRRNGVKHTVRRKLLRPYLCGSKYPAPCVSLSRPGYRERRYVGSLVRGAFSKPAERTPASAGQRRSRSSEHRRDF
jgi:hypothetical protein